MIDAMSGDATCATSSGRITDAWSTNVRVSSGRTRNRRPPSTRSRRVGSSDARSQKSCICGRRVMKSRNDAARSGLVVCAVATRALPPKSLPPRSCRGA